MAIGISRNITIPDKVGASFISVSNRQYYDFKLEVDILFKSEGQAGVAFRYKDPYNFYAFIINRNQGYKSVVRVRHGVRSELKRVVDGGIVTNYWHRVTITSEADRFRIHIYDMENNSTPSSLIEFRDYGIPSGT